MAFDLDKLERQAVELDAELAAKRFSARSADGIVAVTVTGQGKLVTLSIADGALKDSHPQDIGPAVVEAVSAARSRASAESMAKLRAVLDKDQEWIPEGISGAEPNERADPGIPTRAPYRSTALEESFEEIDFLSDPGIADESERRW